MAIPQSTVLVVEDQPLIRLALVLALEEEGFRVVQAGTVLEAVSVLSHHVVDAVVTDVDMPGGLSGLDLVDLLSAMRMANIIVVSGRPLPALCVLPRGAVFVPKPYDCGHIVAEVARNSATVRPLPLAHSG